MKQRTGAVTLNSFDRDDILPMSTHKGVQVPDLSVSKYFLLYEAIVTILFLLLNFELSK